MQLTQYFVWFLIITYIFFFPPKRNTVGDENVVSGYSFGRRIPYAGQKKRISRSDGLFMEG